LVSILIPSGNYKIQKFNLVEIRFLAVCLKMTFKVEVSSLSSFVNVRHFVVNVIGLCPLKISCVKVRSRVILLHPSG